MRGVLALIGFGLACAGLLGLAALAARRRGSRELGLLAIGCAGALLALGNEPIFDVLGRIRYAADQPMLFSSFGRSIPVFLIPGYLGFVGALPVLLAIKLRAEPERAASFAGLCFAAVAAIETLGVSSGAWSYDGGWPAGYVAVAPQMAAVPLLAAWLLAAGEARLSGAQRLLLLGVPPSSLAAVYAATGWPAYLALHSAAPALLDWLAALATLALCVAIVAVLQAAWASLVPDRRRQPEPAAPAGALAEPAVSR